MVSSDPGLQVGLFCTGIARLCAQFEQDLQMLQKNPKEITDLDAMAHLLSISGVPNPFDNRDAARRNMVRAYTEKLLVEGARDRAAFVAVLPQLKDLLGAAPAAPIVDAAGATSSRGPGQNRKGIVTLSLLVVMWGAGASIFISPFIGMGLALLGLGALAMVRSHRGGTPPDEEKEA
jgi:hypothetical protein